MWFLPFLALAKTRVGLAVIATVLFLVGGLILVNRHDAKVIADYDRAGAAQVQERVNESLHRGDAVPADPDRVQQDDRRCRDCR